MWATVELRLDEPGTIEYGIYQRDALQEAPIWRRPTRGKRFESIRGALFNKQGARNACLGNAPYPQERYGATPSLAVAYAATWNRGDELALLVRSSNPDPEVTLVPSVRLDAINFTNAAELTNHLSELFGEGAAAYGVRLLREDKSIVEP